MPHVQYIKQLKSTEPRKLESIYSPHMYIVGYVIGFLVPGRVQVLASNCNVIMGYAATMRASSTA